MATSKSKTRRLVASTSKRSAPPRPSNSTVSKPKSSTSALSRRPRRAAATGARSKADVKGKAKGRKAAAALEEEEVELSEKARGKRRKADPDPVEEASGDEYEGSEVGGAPKSSSGGLVRSYTRVVPHKAVDKTWKKLSANARAGLRGVLDDAALELLAGLDRKHRDQVAGVLQEVFAEADEYMLDIKVPLATTAARQTAATKGEIDVLTSQDLHARIALMEAALEPELEEVQLLQRALKAEKHLLEKDEARLSSFEDGRAKVEKAERKDRSKNMHPLLHQLLDSQPTPSEFNSELDLFARSTISNAWISESALAALSRKPLPTLHEDDDDEESEEEASDGEYDPSKDDYLVQLSQRLGTSLTEIEKRLEGVSRVGTLLSTCESAIAALL